MRAILRCRECSTACWGQRQAGVFCWHRQAIATWRLQHREDKDSDFLYLKPFFDKTAGDGMTLFDLRALPKVMKSIEEKVRAARINAHLRK
jgi:hypothetical protein